MLRMPEELCNKSYSTSNLFLICWSISMVRLGSLKYRLPAGPWCAWFAYETPLSLRPPTSWFNLVILRQSVELFVYLLQLGRSFFWLLQGCSTALSFFWMATWLRMARKTCTRYRCLDLLKLRASHADAQSLRGCGTEKPAFHHPLPLTTSSLY